MIIIKNTDNLTGVCVSGDFYDLDNLYESLRAITVDELSEKHTEYIDISMRLLGLCYQIRHSLQGDREIDLVDNRLDDETMKRYSMIVPKSNVYYKFNYFYTEMMFVMLAINALLKLRIDELGDSKLRYDNAFDKKVIWDEAINTVRSFQAKFASCVRNTLSDNAYARWRNLMNSNYIFIEDITHQYIDLLNIEFLKLDKESRLKKLNTFSKSIAEYRASADHEAIREVVEQAAKEHRCDRAEIRMESLEYPDEIEW